MKFALLLVFPGIAALSTTACTDVPDTNPSVALFAGSSADAEIVSVYEAKNRLLGKDVSAVWLPDGTAFYFSREQADGYRFYRVDPVRNSVEELIDAKRVRAQLTKLTHVDGIAADVDTLPFSTLRLDPTGTTAYFTFEGRAFELDLESYVLDYVRPNLPHGEPDPAVAGLAKRGFPRTWPDRRELPSPDGSLFIGLAGPTLLLRSSNTFTPLLTFDGTPEQPWLIRGATWSPDSARFVAIRANLRDVSPLPITDWNKPFDEPLVVPWSNAGGTLPTYSGTIVNVRTGERRDFNLGAEPYYRVVGWSADASEVFVAKLSRNAKRIEVIAIDAETADQRTILVEVAQTFFHFPPNVTHREGVPFHLLSDNEHFVWASERDGYKQLYLYRLDGTFVRQLTTGDYPVVEFGGEIPASREILFTASSDPNRPYDIHVHKASLDGGSATRLSTANGQHEIQVSPSGAYYLDKYSTTGTLPKTELRRTDGELVRVLSEATFDGDITFIVPEHFTAKAADGETDIHGVIFKPRGFDPSKSYPVVENIYAGPFVQYVPYKFDSTRPRYGDYLFENGYIEVVIDGRGTPGRGKAFQDVAYRNVGQHESADHAAALQQAAKTRPWMDMDRVGIFGNSYGGYFALRALLQAPNVYHVAVAAGTPIRNENTSAAANEVYLGLYEDGGAAWSQASMTELAGNLRGHLLLIKGTSDANTPLHGTLAVAEVLIRADKKFDMLVIPGVNHHYHGIGYSHRSYMKKAIVRYLDEHLKAAE